MEPVEHYIARVKQPAPRRTALPAPAFSHEPWCRGDITVLANCYAYALNFVPGRTNWFPAPGDRAVRAPARTVSALFNAAVSDGLVPAAAASETELPAAVTGYYLAALFSNAAGDNWHWYRQDADGTWSHKDGQTYPTRFDAAGQHITDPRLAARPQSNAAKLVSFFYVPNEGLGFPALKREIAAPAPYFYLGR